MNGGGFHPSCEVSGSMGRVVYCARCRRMALEYGSRRMIFHRRIAGMLLGHLAAFCALSRGPDEAVPLVMGPGAEGECIRLGPAEAKEAAELIETASVLMDAATASMPEAEG
jgi:hypothetical protein